MIPYRDTLTMIPVAVGFWAAVRHRISHWLRWTTCHTDHFVHTDGHEYVWIVCDRCDHRTMLAHSAACETCSTLEAT